MLRLGVPGVAMSLEDTGIIVTGGSRGLGKAVAGACLAEGGDVLICGRDEAALEQAKTELAAQARPKQQVISICLDISHPDSADILVRTACECFGRFTGLVNNAGVYGPKGLVEEIDWEEWVDAIRINLLSTVRLCRAAVPVFRRQGHGKIVNLSGGGATAPMPRFSAYAASKAAIVRFTETLAHETCGAGIDVNAIAPGALNTRLLDEVLAAGPEKVGAQFYERALRQRADGGASPERAAALCVYLLSRASDGISGRLLSAIWDPWPTLADRLEQLRITDVYTLRRIVPGDRGLDWDDQ